jgi:hypothetical protein
MSSPVKTAGGGEAYRGFMMTEEQRPAPVVRYLEYTPVTIEYMQDIDAYTVARADIVSSDRRHRLTLVVVVTEGQMIVHRPGLEEAIRQGRRLLERLVTEHGHDVDHLTVSAWRVYNLTGQRLQ